MHRKAIFLIGGTGMGKTKLGVQLAEAFSGEVVNSDAMQLYQGLPIATAQPSEAEKRGVAHHLMGILSPSESWTVRDYRDSALRAMEDIWQRGKTPIVVGGTLYYVQALIWKALADEQASFKRPKTMDKEEEEEGESAYDRLKRLDPERASQLHPNDSRKIERSLELLQETGGGAVPDSTNALDEVRLTDCRILWVHCDDDAEVERLLASRVEAMFQAGLVREVDEFTNSNGDEPTHKRGVFQAIGIKDHDMLVVKHRQYVKSQLKWIRKRILPRSVPVHCLAFSKREEWDSKVGDRGAQIASAFLGGSSMTDFPTCNTATASATGADGKLARMCEACNNRVLVGDDAWQKHLAGRSHRTHAQRRVRVSESTI